MKYNYSVDCMTNSNSGLAQLLYGKDDDEKPICRASCNSTDSVSVTKICDIMAPSKQRYESITLLSLSRTCAKIY